jgi:hypothetical protein
MAIFRQDDFSGGLDTRLDIAKTSDNSYALLMNGRVRRNVIAPVPKHLPLDAPEGTKQGLYLAGSDLILFVDGRAYRADITTSPIIFYPVANWTNMSPTTPRIYAELVPATSNRFNRTGSPDTVVKVFNNSLAVFPEALFCFDGTSQGQAILPSGVAAELGTYAQWTKDDPNYVPVGKLPAFCANKLFMVSPDGKSIYHSVSGRAHDFMVNIDVAGNAGGDASTVSQTVSYHDITALRAISSGAVLVGTLYSTHILELDYTQKQFGEPYLNPITLFPAGIINELSIIDVLSDTAFITQSGIHAFNVVEQAKRESNNFPFGAPIRGLLTNPVTDKAIIQEDTCTGLYNDYALFAVNTIHGYGVVVYDTITETFHSLDLSFGHVKQFAWTRLNGQERLFFITHENQLFEAFASTESAAARVYLGEWTPDTANEDLLITMVDLQFTACRTSGQCKISVFADSKLHESIVIECEAPGFNVNLPIPIPFPDAKQVIPVGFQLRNSLRAWKVGVLIEWNFDGKLSDISLDGAQERAENVTLDIAVSAGKDKVTFLADSGYPTELNTGGSFPAAGFEMYNVVQGERYVFLGNGNGPLANGSIFINEGIFTAKSDKVVVKGTGAKLFSLRNGENYFKVLDAISREKPREVWHGGDFGYDDGMQLEVRAAMLPIKLPTYYTSGNHDLRTNSGRYFFNLLRMERFYGRTLEFVDVFFFNSDASEPFGTGVSSIQAGYLRNFLASSTKPFKFVVTHQPPYSNDVNHAPGNTGIRWLLNENIHGLFCGHSHNMERIIVGTKPIFICGAGGHSLRGFVSPRVVDNSFENSTDYGYLTITADDLTCRVEFKNVNGVVLDYYDIYA